MSAALPHLFRTEYRKIVSVLCRSFGLRDLETAEDIASETFLTATQTWGIEGLPPNPTAWLYTVARNKANNHLKRIRTFNEVVGPAFRAQHDGRDQNIEDVPGTAPTEDFFEDSQLRLMFALCHPAIAPEVQVALCLRLLCGFGIGEIAGAFMTGKETITKRLLRGKARFREENIGLELPEVHQLNQRTASVLTTIYLLFNEGYYASEGDAVVRKELCLEAVRLCAMLIERPATNCPDANALMALMCFHLSRFDSRLGGEGEVILYEDQDTMTWNPEWVSRGGYFLQRSTGLSISAYHVEAAIAYQHTQFRDDKWSHILRQYDVLMRVKPSPVVAMNRAYAVYKVSGAKAAIAALEGVELTDSHLYHALLGLLWSTEDKVKAAMHTQKAILLAPSQPVRDTLNIRLASLC